MWVRHPCLTVRAASLPPVPMHPESEASCFPGRESFKMTITRKHKMKQMSIWQRLNTALLVLVLLLMAGCGLALWIEEAVTKADRVGEELTAKKERIRLNLLSMSDSLR